MYDCLPKMLCVYCIYIYIYIYHVNKFEARLKKNMKKFDVTNGVKQGGVLSPLLFSVYI